MEQENDEMLNCCSFLQVYFPSITSESIQGSASAFCKSESGKDGEGEDLAQITRAKHLYQPFIRIPQMSLCKWLVTTYNKEKLQSEKQVYVEQMESNKCHQKFSNLFLVNFLMLFCNSGTDPWNLSKKCVPLRVC